MSGIRPETAAEYDRIAEGFLKRELDAHQIPRTAKMIADALRAWSAGKRPVTYRKMRRALAHHQRVRAYEKAAKRIEAVERHGHGQANTTKRSRCKKVTQADHDKLLADAIERGDAEVAAALTIAFWTGSRPVEMTKMRCKLGAKDGEQILAVAIASAKQGADRSFYRVLMLEPNADLAAAIDRLYGLSPMRMKAIQARLRYYAKKLFPRRKHPPSLYSYRHELGSDLKAKGDRVEGAAILGHRSQESLEVYGRRNTGGGLDRGELRVPDWVRQRVNPPEPRSISRKHPAQGPAPAM